MKVVYHGNSSREVMRVEVLGVTVELHRAWLRDGTVAMVGTVDERLGEGFRRLPRYEVLTDAAAAARGAVVSEPAAPEVVPAPAASRGFGPLEAAVANGWTAEDLAGTGIHGNPGASGGYSPRTGMTLADMALAVPPPEWPENASEGYPWECASWRAPYPGWTPPQAPLKAWAAMNKAEPDAIAQPVLDVEPIAPPAPPVPRTTAPKPDAPASTPTLDARAEWTAPARRGAAELLRTLADAAGHAPSRQKANYHLRKLNLPTVDDDELAELLTLTT